MVLDKLQIKEFSLKVFLVICIILPTGSIFDINIKMLMLGILFIISLFDGKAFVKLVISNYVPIFLLVVLMAIGYFKNGLIPESYGQAKDILVFFIMISLCVSLIDKEKQGEVIFGVIVKCLVYLAVFKLLIVLFSVVTGASVASVVKIISQLFNTSLMTMESDEIVVGRINLMSDALIPISLFIVTQNAISKKKSGYNFLILFLLSFSIIMSLSRFLWGIGLFCILLAVILNLKYVKGFFIAIGFFLFSVFLLSLPYVQSLIEFRFNSKQVGSSDDTRIYQLTHIMDSFSDAPLLGHGIGFYLTNLIRSYTAKYSYEAQIPALLMQIGIIGTLAIFIIIFYVLFRQAKFLTYKMKFVYLLLISTWIASGFFNPVFISSSGGMVFLLLYALPQYVSNNKSHAFTEVDSYE